VRSTRPIRLLYCITAGPEAVRAAEFLHELVNDGRFEVEVALDDAAHALVRPAGLRWRYGVPVHEGLFQGDTAVHARLGVWADVIAVLPATRAFAQRLAAGRYSDLVSATIAASTGKVVLFSPGAADVESQRAADTLAAEGFSVISGDDTRADRVSPSPGELPDALAALAAGGVMVIPARGEPRRAPQRPLRVAYAISGAIGAVCASAWLEGLAGFEVAIIATNAASEMVAVEGLRSAYGAPHVPAPSGLAAWADVAVVVPATAEFLCRAADGDRSDIVSATVADVPRVVLVPSMNPLMWGRRAVQDAVARLAGRGANVVLPGAGCKVIDRSAPPGVGGIGVPPSQLPALLRLAARGWKPAPASASRPASCSQAAP
jgi:phosphopantothenoylcysteine decarboxylase/phosphopantothenate--cysteine ligase